MRFKKILMISLLILCLAPTAVSLAQTPPTLILEDSIKIAHEELKKAEFDVSNHYIFSITLTNSSDGTFWYYTYRPYQPSQYREFFIKVYMDGTCTIIKAKKPRDR
ncbi:MAG: hypothetical protein ABIC68_08550 [Candidatus Omnitrophota bacterium]